MQVSMHCATLLKLLQIPQTSSATSTAFAPYDTTPKLPS
jgi:hypothetical protein